MQDITLGPFDDSGFMFYLGALGRHLEELTDTRGAQGKIYTLARILTWMLLARLCGENTPHGIFEWVRLRQEVLVRLFDCIIRTMPITNSGACRSLIPGHADHRFRPCRSVRYPGSSHLRGTTLDNLKHVGHSLPKEGGRDVARKVIHAKNRRNSAIEI